MLGWDLPVPPSTARTVLLFLSYSVLGLGAGGFLCVLFFYFCLFLKKKTLFLFYIAIPVSSPLFFCCCYCCWRTVSQNFEFCRILASIGLFVCTFLVLWSLIIQYQRLGLVTLSNYSGKKQQWQMSLFYKDTSPSELGLTLIAMCRAHIEQEKVGSRCWCGCV